jgi:hypothetical protein
LPTKPSTLRYVEVDVLVDGRDRAVPPHADVHVAVHLNVHVRRRRRRANYATVIIALSNRSVFY